MGKRQLAALDALVAEITTDAYGEAEQLWAFRQAFQDGVSRPCDALVIDELVSVVEFCCDGNERRGVTARCRRPDGREYVIAAADVVFAPGTEGARYVAAYRKWMGLTSDAAEATPPSSGKVGRRVAKQSVELAVLSSKRVVAVCRLLESGRNITLRARRHWVPGEILRIKVGEDWTERGSLSSPEIESARIDARALGLTPLRLKECGIWNPIDEYWGEAGEPIAGWARPIIAKGPRPAFEMEQVLPGYTFDDPDCDPIGVSNDLRESGNIAGAYKALMDLCEADLRCLDAHAHLGNLAFEKSAREAIGHYEVGLGIGELSLPEGFDGVLPWGWIDNRPFLRSMHGFGLCLWRLGRFTEASRIFKRMLWLNPTDNQGVRLLISDVRAKRSWEDRRDF
jgi:hypothetical protein